ncbi:peptidase C15 [Alloscardovia macacae]|uniref:Pyrrolidone-carboxylate peptidase n=1 Tax=Alloscardovia macacae TaxID=1160091 RepID=A0A1Y2SVP3_9BIFI|nr:pyroglutamyl-peptidase I [Alloscardovia macacae]OTA27319.1 peptidase C15 [Alloscardovia macacae]OTA29326.1 peptidase C15 [Alloscardovia macacae]
MGAVTSRIVVCGFEGYEDLEESQNPSRLVATRLADEGIDVSGADTSADTRIDTSTRELLSDTRIEVTSVLLPLSFAHAWPTLEATLRETRPQMVLATGLKTRARTIALERCARNIIDAPRPDADDVQPQNTSIIEGGPAAYWTRIPLRAVSRQFARQDIPATLSSDVGTFVCNALFYEMLHWASGEQDAYAGFLSVPPIERPLGYTKGMELQTMVDAARSVVTTTLAYRKALT